LYGLGVDPLPTQKIETLEDAARYLEGLINRERQTDYSYKRLDLSPIRALMDALGNPQQQLSILHVAGSKGKGSTCLFAESILLALGQSVGTFTSPHLESWVERFRVDGKPIDGERLARIVERIRPVVDTLRDGPEETRPSFFDATTAVAFLVFAEAKVDCAVIEVGLGGRLDSTNIVDPEVTCITSIELEHTDKLGDTEALIAGEKAGILKSDRPVVLGAFRADAERVIRARAQEVGAPIRALGHEFEAAAVQAVPDSQPFPRTAQTLRFRSAGQTDFAFEAPLAMSGRPALLNAALAVECVRAMGVASDTAVARAARKALGRRRLPGRIEILKGDPQVIIDGAHTVESARALAAVLAEIAPEGFDLLLSVSADKNLDGLLDAVLPRALRVITTRAERMRSMPSAELAEHVRKKRPGIPVEAIDDPRAAVLRARATLPAEGRLCATGSTYLAGIARRVLLTDRMAEATGVEPELAD
jgi:dihydrofolate synthase/folylpolyglutamate synthase